MTQPKPEKHFWKSLEERDGQAATRPDEVPVGEGLAEGLADILARAAELRMDRADFLKWAGLSAAAAALAGCGKAAEKALPYLNQPDDRIPGELQEFSGVCAACEAGCGLIARTREGRPLKLEGNPGHPLNRGGLCGLGQASLLGLYDERRPQGPLLRGAEASWDAVDTQVRSALAQDGGKGVRILTRSVLSPTLKAQLKNFEAAFPGSRSVVYDPLPASAIGEAHARTHGVRRLPHYHFDRASVLLSVGADFLGTWISPVEFAGAYLLGRDASTPQAGFSRHYQIEAGLSLSGAKADVRWALESGAHPLFLAHLARALGVAGDWTGGRPCPVAGDRLQALASDLRRAGSGALVVASSQDLDAQILVNLLNQHLGGYGHTLDVRRPSLQRQGEADAVPGFLEELRSGQVRAVLVLSGDPVAEWPEGAELTRRLAELPLSVSLAYAEDDTAQACGVLAPDHHPLEAWFDAEPVTGCLGLSQPMIRPLGNTRSALESLAVWSGKPVRALDALKERWRREVYPHAPGGLGFEAFWERCLETGFVELPTQESVPTFRTPKPEPVSANLEGLELLCEPKVLMGDGRLAGNPWLWEVPDPLHKIAWDQVLQVHPETARKLGWSEGSLIRLSAEGVEARLELPAHLQVGLAPGTLSVPLGYGRLASRRFHDVGPDWLFAQATVEAGKRLGQDTRAFWSRGTGGLLLQRFRVHARAAGGRRLPANAQIHQSLDARGARQAAQEMDWSAWRSGAQARRGGPIPPAPAHQSGARQWAMRVDLNACTGCSACVVACQVENNIPVVGRDESARGHALHWLRIDRYYAEGPQGLESLNLPMFCQQCGAAPCENVCPVDATSHNAEGLNVQTYNRCVGTRFCANNCPYEVRRFNWFEPKVLKGRERLALNPDVSVRSRGVMEKCSFCIQRIQRAEATARREGRALKDSEVRTACQQSCPTQAIRFGDRDDPTQSLRAVESDPRAYGVLEDLGVRPAVTYLVQVRHGL
jgi:molybdopterin-containing oxidoreductase family iron-sulfur binding subunit